MSLLPELFIQLLSLTPPLLQLHDLLFQRLFIVRELPQVPEHVRVVLAQLPYLLIFLPHHGLLLPDRSCELLDLHPQFLLTSLLTHLLLSDQRHALFHFIGLRPTRIELLLEDRYQVLVLIALCL